MAARAKTYVIPFAGLSTGRHEFVFETGDKFFDAFEYSEIKKADVKVNVSLNRQSTMLILNFKMEGTVNVMCDRCSDLFDLAIEGEAQLIVKFGDELAEEEEIITIPHSESELDIAQYIYEYINLAVPYKRTHQKIKDCNKEVIKKLEAVEKEIADSRWEKLKNIKINKN